MTREIPLTRGLVALVDDDDYERVIALGSWCALLCGRKFYAGRSFQRDGERGGMLMHKFLTGYAMTDHRNGDGLDNRRANLRIATYAQNNQNRRPNRAGSSVHKGVCWDRRKSKWRAAITQNGRYRHLGYFDAVEDAARAYDAAAREAFGEFAWLNFPDVDREQVNA